VNDLPLADWERELLEKQAAESATAPTEMTREQLIRERALRHAVHFGSSLNLALREKGEKPVKGRALLSLAEAYAAFIRTGERLPDPEESAS